jgi:hypothetical protein
VLLFGALSLISPFAAAQTTTSSALLTENPKSQYYMVKRALLDLRQGMIGTHDYYLYTNIETNPSPEDRGTYDLFLCQEVGTLLGDNPWKAPDPVPDLGQLALRVMIWHHDLEKLGYPEAVWLPTLNDFENRQFDLIMKENAKQEASAPDKDKAVPDENAKWDAEEPPSEKDFEATAKKLAVLLNDYRRKTNPGLTRMVVEGGCGAGEVSIQVHVEPKDGRVFFQSAFFHKLCEAQHLDPNDVEHCDRWYEAIDGKLDYVAGDYFYIARWPDGKLRQGELSFRRLKQDQSVVFTKP